MSSPDEAIGGTEVEVASLTSSAGPKRLEGLGAVAGQIKKAGDADFLQPKYVFITLLT